MTLCALDCFSACASVFAAINSTPQTPLLIMCCTAFPPAPPTPTTLITVPRLSSSIRSISMITPFSKKQLSVDRHHAVWRLATANCGCYNKRLLKLEITQEPLFHTLPHRLHRTILA